jgi:hypothetical protein
MPHDVSRIKTDGQTGKEELKATNCALVFVRYQNSFPKGRIAWSTPSPFVSKRLPDTAQDVLVQGFREVRLEDAVRDRPNKGGVLPKG